MDSRATELLHVVALCRHVERTVGADREALGVGQAGRRGRRSACRRPSRWSCRAPTGRPASRGGTPSSCSSPRTARSGSTGRTRGRSCRGPPVPWWSSRRTPDRPPSPTSRPATSCALAGAGPVPEGASGMHGGFVAPVPSPPTIVTGPHAAERGGARRTDVAVRRAFEPSPSPTAERTQARTLLAPSGTHVVGTPETP